MVGKRRRRCLHVWLFPPFSVLLPSSLLPLKMFPLPAWLHSSLSPPWAGRSHPSPAWGFCGLWLSRCPVGAPGPPRASCAATGPLPSVTASPHPALAGFSSAGPASPICPGPSRGRHPQNSALVCGPELLHSGCQSSDSFSPGSQQAGGSGREMGGCMFQGLVEATPSHPPCRDACCHGQSTSAPRPCQCSLDKGRRPGHPGSGPTSLVAFSWG